MSIIQMIGDFDVKVQFCGGNGISPGRFVLDDDPVPMLVSENVSYTASSAGAAT